MEVKCTSSCVFVCVSILCLSVSFLGLFSSLKRKMELLRKVR